MENFMVVKKITKFRYNFLEINIDFLVLSRLLLRSPSTPGLFVQG